MINRVTLVGRLTRDIELRFTKDQIPVATFTIAMDRMGTSRDNKVTDFISCTVWRSAAEYASKYAVKGSLVGVDGKLQSRSYDDKNGRRVSVVEVLCDSFQLLEWKKTGSTYQADKDNHEMAIDAPSRAENETDISDELEDEKFQISDDDLPF